VQYTASTMVELSLFLCATHFEIEYENCRSAIIPIRVWRFEAIVVLASARIVRKIRESIDERMTTLGVISSGLCEVTEC